jgi:ABC-2 type transport system ATP-binding protein
VPIARDYRAGVAGVIEAEELRRTYRTTTGIVRRRPLEVEAVRGISFEVARGELFGLLGPNGAGKTTTIKMLITLLLPTAGSARVLGFDVVRDAREVRRRIGYVFGGERGLYERLSGLDNLRYFGELYGLSGKRARVRIQEVIDLVGLQGRERERVEGYSRGMRQRLHIARGILHDPEVVFLDEPTIGVDPVGARALRSTIAGLVETGKTVLLTTHYMFEADSLCDRVAVIARGRIVAEGTPAELKDHVADSTVVEVEVFGIEEADVARVRSLPGITSVSIEEREQVQLLTIQSPRALELMQELHGFFDGARIGRIAAREPTLEDAYVALVTEAGE